MKLARCLFLLGLSGSVAVSGFGATEASPGRAKVDCGKAVCDCSIEGTWCGQADWAFSLFREAAPAKGNAVLSPFSVASALGLTGLGANGETGEEMAKVLGFPDFVELLTAWPGVFQSLADATNESVRLEMTNSLWPKREVAGHLNRRFLHYAKDVFHAEVQPISMDASGQEAVNAFVAAATKGRIPQLLSEPPDAATQLLILNTVWLKAKWAHPFKPSQTEKGIFHATDGDAEASFLHLAKTFAYAKTEGVEAVCLPYAGGGVEMLVLLPEKGVDFASFEKELSLKKLRALQAAFKDEVVDLALPKFELESTADLTNPLQAMGMKKAFSWQADFSGISRDIPLSISQVFQKANITVDEEETEAAAATAVVMERSSMLPPRPTVSFRADRPFFFVIRHRKTNLVLFLGRVEKPIAPTGGTAVER